MRGWDVFNILLGCIAVGVDIFLTSRGHPPPLHQAAIIGLLYIGWGVDSIIRGI